MVDDGRQQRRADAAAAVSPANGDGQQFRLVGRDPAERQADIRAVDLKQQAGDAGRGQQFGDVLPRPGALAERHEGRGMQGGRPVEIERAQTTKTTGSVIQSTVRRAPSGRVTLTPRR